MFKQMKEYHEKFNSLNNLKAWTEDTEKLKQEVLTNVGDIYNELYYIYKSKHSKKINSLNAKNKQNLDYKKLRLCDNYLYSSEEEQEKKQEKQKSKKNKKNKKKQDEKITDANEFNEWINKEETGINRELFNKHFHYQTPSALFKDLYNTNDKEKNSLLVSVINSGIQDLKKGISKMSEDEKKLKSQIK